ncbi:tail fiber assembly protein [Enterobacter ludwigii]|uniref:tail fiber assembly protein n=1 Tax=Enterobacter TaxID=547 RepID=UPI00041E448A|nr:tail fiber assembly protein [Enterobacter ludwigii]
MTMTYFYSASTNAFYPLELKKDYEEAGTWPEDTVDISEAEYQALLSGQSEGLEITPDANGRPTLSEPVVDPVVVAEGTKRQLLAEVREKIAILQDAADLGMATDEENAQLIAWKNYRVLLNRVNTSTAPDIQWTDVPEF